MFVKTLTMLHPSQRLLTAQEPQIQVRIVVHVSEILFYKVLHENFSNRYLGVKISNKIISESSSCLLFYFHVFFFFFFFFARGALSAR